MNFRGIRHLQTSILLALLLVFTLPPCSAEALRVPEATKEQQDLHSTLLTEALRRGGVYTKELPYGDIETIPLSTRIEGLRNKELDIFAAMSNTQLEDEFTAIYIPIYRGLMGMRLAIVKQDKAHIFETVHNFETLRKYTAGQGKLWADSDILDANNLPLVRELKYQNLFRMLEADRFDYFPRGIHEPWEEVKKWSDLDLIVDENIMIWYTAPFYYFVDKNTSKLANHLHEQLIAMVDDGTFEKLFKADKKVQKSFRLANIPNRKIIRLKNPELTPNTPLDDERLWFKIQDALGDN